MDGIHGNIYGKSFEVNISNVKMKQEVKGFTTLVKDTYQPLISQNEHRDILGFTESTSRYPHYLNYKYEVLVKYFIAFIYRYVRPNQIFFLKICLYR